MFTIIPTINECKTRERAFAETCALVCAFFLSGCGRGVEEEGYLDLRSFIADNDSMRGVKREQLADACGSARFSPINIIRSLKDTFTFNTDSLSN